MKALVTGAAGFIGYHVVKALQEHSLDIRALVRTHNPIQDLQSLGVEITFGDVRDADSVYSALKGCHHVYHLAADYRLWVLSPQSMYEVNVQGTKNIMHAALRRGIEKVIYTSSVGVLAASKSGCCATEDTPVSMRDMVGHYKRSKFLAEEEVRRFVDLGLPAVIVNPAAPIGAFDRKPTPTGKIIVDFLKGKLPAYLDTGLNFVDVEDVAEGHWLASIYGKIGERYILGNRNMTLRDFLVSLATITGGTPPRVRLPYYPLLLAAFVNEAVSRWITHKPPLIPLSGVRMARRYMFFDCSKAVTALKLPQHSVEAAMEEAVLWFKSHGYVGI